MNDQVPTGSPARPTPLLTVVVPVRNEAANIGPLVAEIRRALAGVFEYELVVVDDGSSDGTWGVLNGLVSDGANRLSCLRHEKSCGQSSAVLTGARAGRGEWLVVLDGDGQNDPADIPGMVNKVVAAAGADPRVAGVIGHRVNRRDTWKKRAASRLANSFRGMVLADGIPDIGCGLKVVRRETYLGLPPFDHMHRYIPVLIQAQGGIMLVHPVSHRPRSSGRSNYGVWDRLRVGVVDILGVWWLKRRTVGARVLERI